jgi:hypothetical protein
MPAGSSRQGPQDVSRQRELANPPRKGDVMAVAEPRHHGLGPALALRYRRVEEWREALGVGDVDQSQGLGLRRGLRKPAGPQPALELPDQGAFHYATLGTLPAAVNARGGESEVGRVPGASTPGAGSVSGAAVGRLVMRLGCSTRDLLEGWP